MILMIMNNILNMTYGIIMHKIKLLKMKMKIIVNKCEEIKEMI